MLLITNNCTGGYFYRDVVKKEYNHPFFWGTMRLSMLDLVLNFDTINFDNYEIIKDKKWNFSLKIDNKITYDLLHYHFSVYDNQPRNAGCDIYYNRIWEYILYKYETRLARFKELKENPIFAIQWFPGDGFNENILNEFIKNEFKYKTIIFMPYKKYKNYRKDNLILIYDELSKSPLASEKLAKKVKQFV